MDGKGRVKGAK
jgi:hypothetical protein